LLSCPAPAGLAFGEPDDRLRRGIQYAAASRFNTDVSGILVVRSSRTTTPKVRRA
jgi:hypothetical protein